MTTKLGGREVPISASEVIAVEMASAVVISNRIIVLQTGL